MTRTDGLHCFPFALAWVSDHCNQSVQLSPACGIINIEYL
jgi:hypothetical protein